MDFTPLVRPGFLRLARRTDSWISESPELQISTLRSLISRGSSAEYGRQHGFPDLLGSSDLLKAYRENVPMTDYEAIREPVMRMIRGERDVLWPGVCRDYAQSSGTSGGKSKYIPITGDSLKGNHYAGGADVVAHYLRLVPESRLFSGKNFILGGSFSNTLGFDVPGVHVGDLSATLIRKINPLANIMRIPSRRVALMPDWETKLPALVAAAKDRNVTGISGVPSWFLTVIKRIMEAKGVETISEVWPNLEVFFHGGISFEPYREEYRRLTEGAPMHFLETYNASEGFFAVQNDFSDRSMLLIIDRDIFYEFIPLDGSDRSPKSLWEVKAGDTYELVISASNGLFRYRLGDTVRVTQTSPVKIQIAGRTRTFINAFGEELMEDNAERGMAEACRRTGAVMRNYTAGPQFASGNRKGRHQWVVEWEIAPGSNEEFAVVLDEELRKLNSDYDAKRSHTIFLDLPEVISARSGLFDDWLKSQGSHKLGGQRKVPRLSNDRRILDTILAM